MTPKQQRLSGLALIFFGISISIALSLWGFRENVSFFFTPADLQETRPSGNFRLGGLVKEDSIKKDGLTTKFTVMDKNAELDVTYTGILPDLFTEGQGVIATGSLNQKGDLFMADSLLAKHDENYMPPEVAAKLKEQGHMPAP